MGAAFETGRAVGNAYQQAEVQYAKPIDGRLALNTYTLGDTPNSFQFKQEAKLALWAASDAVAKQTNIMQLLAANKKGIDPQAAQNGAKDLAADNARAAVPSAAGDAALKERWAQKAADNVDIAGILARMEPQQRNRPDPATHPAQTRKPLDPAAQFVDKQGSAADPQKLLNPNRTVESEPHPAVERILPGFLHSPLHLLEERPKKSNPLTKPDPKDAVTLACTLGLAAAKAMQPTPAEQARIQAEKDRNRQEIADRRQKIASLSNEISQALAYVRGRRDIYLAEVYHNQAELERHKARIEQLTPYT